MLLHSVGCTEPMPGLCAKPDVDLEVLQHCGFSQFLYFPFLLCILLLCPFSTLSSLSFSTVPLLPCEHLWQADIVGTRVESISSVRCKCMRYVPACVCVNMASSFDMPQKNYVLNTQYGNEVNPWCVLELYIPAVDRCTVWCTEPGPI
jgi:hypothetical protein